MARADFDPLDFGEVIPESAFAELPESQYRPQAPAQRNSAPQNQNLAYAYDYLLKQGFKPHQAAGIVGNLAQESGGNTGAVGGKILPGEAYSFGAAQWNKERLHGGKGYTGLLPFAKAQGQDPSNLYTQLDYMMHELRGPERKALEGILASKNVDEATRVFGEAYERPNAKYANYENRIAKARQYLGGAPAEMPQGPQGETYDIPLSNGRTLTVPKDVSRQDAIAGLRAQGMDVEGVKDHPLTNGKTLTLPESFDVNEALKQLQAQHPDQEWMTKEHAEKTGFLPAAEAAFKGLLPQAKRGAGEIFEEFGPTREMGRNWIEESKKAQEELAKVAEKPLPTDPLSKQIAYYGGTAAGGFLPFVAGAALAPELAVPLALGSTPILAAGSLGQRYDEEGKPLELSEPRNLAALGAETALQTAGLRGLAPVAGQFTKSAIKGALGAAAADVPSVAIERAAAGQPLTDEEALKEYGGALAADVLGGGTLGAAGALRGRGRAPEAELPPETPPAPEAAAPETPIQPAPEGGEALAPTEGPVESVEDLEAQARAGEDFFRQAEAAGIPPEAVAPEAIAPETEIPEPTVRGEAQAMPTAEEPAPLSFADLGLKGKNSKVLMRSLNELDMENPEHGKTINEILDRAEEANVQHNPEAMQAIRTKLQEVQDAQQIPQAGEAFRRSGAQPGFREEGRDQAIGGEGVEPSGQRIEAPEVKFAKAEEAATDEITGLPLNEDGTVTLYHHTSADKAVQIRQTNRLKSAAEPDVYLTTRKEADTGYGDTAVPVRVDPRTLQIDDEFPDGRVDYRINTGKPGGSVEVKIETPETRKFAKAEEPTHIDVDGIQRPVHDSTGQRIHTTDEGVKNFWKGFEGTKVTDEAGRPVRVYHGTDEKFNTFEMNRKTQRGVMLSQFDVESQGAFFSPSKIDAEQYGRNVDAYYLKIHKPLSEASKEQIDYILEPAMYERSGRRMIDTDNGISSTEVDSEGNWINKVMADGEIDWDFLDKPEVVARMKELGFDGAKVYEPNDSSGHSWFVVDPKQIKSATDNIGTFDITKPDIREARGVAPETAHSVESLNDHIVKTYGKNAPQVEVLTREQAGVEPNVKGFYDPNTKKVALIADNIGKDEDIHGLMRHEVAVHAKRLGKTDPEFQSILDRLQKLKEQGDATVAKAYDRVPRDTTPENIHEEALAYLTQHAPQLPVVKQFTSWLRRTAHKLTGSSNWLKADDFAPMADAILKKGEPTAAPKERMYSIGDTADEAVRNTNTETWFERFYTPIRTQYASVRAPLEAILGKLPLYDENNEIRATAKIAQQTRYAHLVSEALHNGYLKRNAQGLVEAVFDPRLSPDRLIKRVMELPEDLRDRFSESMVALAQAGHNLRGAEMKAVMDEAQRKIKLGQAYLDRTRTRYEKAEGKLEEAKSASARAKETAAEYSRNVLATAERNASAATAEIQNIASKVNRGLDVDAEVIDAALKRQEKAQADLATAKSFAEKLKRTATTDLEKAQREFDAAKAEYRNPNYTAGKDYIALQQRLYKAVKDQYGKAQRDESGRIYDISPAQERAAREFIESNPEAKQLAADIRELFTNSAKLLRDTSVISNETYKKFTDSKYNYAPLYMSIEDLDAAMPASAVYLQGGQRKVMPVKGLKGGQHQVRFFENLLTHQARTGAMALHNNARLGSLESLAEMGRAKELPGTTPPPKTLDVVAAIKDGKRRYYHVPDRPLYEAFEMVHNLPVPEYITDATKYVSRAMLVDPRYWWNQLVREPFMATFTSRAGIITPYHTGKEFVSLLFSELPNVDTSAAKLYRELKAQGVSGSHEYLRNLIKEKGKLQASKGLAKNYKDSRDLVMRIHEYADAAAKVAVMRKALERAENGKLTGTPLHGDAARDAAITHVGDMINFANRGRNATVQFITQTTPFFNSWAQGMDAIIRSATGYGMDPHAKGKTIAGLRTTFIGHAAAMMAFSAAITALRCEFSEDYRKAEPDEWSGNWLLPIPDSFETKEGRMVKAKGPFELNTLFKLGPEMIVRNWYGLDRDKDYTSTIKSSIWRDIAPPGLDHLFMPYLPMLLLESVTGYRASEGEIKPLADTSLAPAERGKGVSPIADVISAGVLSPASVKHLGQGVFGGMYSLLDSTAKGAAAAFGSDTARADLRDITEKVPVISGMLTNPDHIELGQAYEFADKQAMARHTAKALKQRGDKEGAAEYKEEGRYAKQAERIKRKISKTNTAIERLKNTKEYEDADKLQREYEAQLEKKRKQVEKLEALRTKAEENK